jgi:hypothetical protein
MPTNVEQSSRAEHAPGVDQDNAQVEGRYHSYRTHAIPWFIHLMWVAFWIGSIAYALRYMIPAMQSELTAPP